MRARLGGVGRLGTLLLAAGCDLLPSYGDLTSQYDGSASSAPSPCVAHSHAFCDDFEEGQIDAARWSKVTQQNAAVEVDTARPHSGTHSLKVTAQNVSAQTDVDGRLVETSTFPLLQSDLFARGYVYLPSPLPSENLQFWGTFADYRLNIQSPDQLCLTDLGNPDNFHCSTSPLVSLPTDQWVCLEWEIQNDSAISRVWIGGQLAWKYQPLNGNPMNELGFGFGYLSTTQDEGAYSIWIDDVVVDGQRVGCDSP